jgi:hypothetical protein
MFGNLRVACGRWALAGVAMAAMAAGPRLAWASNIVISDGNFDNWSFASYLSGSGHPKATMSVDKSGGNPAPELVNITEAGTGGTAGGYGYDGASPLNVDLSGAKFVLTVQVKSSAEGRKIGQDIHLLVYQVLIQGKKGSAFISYWHKNTGIGRKSWKTITFHGRLSDRDFTALQGGASEPNFVNAGITTYFGLYAQNSQTGQKIKNFYDNYTLTIIPK